MAKERDGVVIGVYATTELRDEIKRLADKENRSLSAQIVTMLQKALAEKAAA